MRPSGQRPYRTLLPSSLFGAIGLNIFISLSLAVVVVVDAIGQGWEMRDDDDDDVAVQETTSFITPRKPNSPDYYGLIV